jgi:hypothetical protein
VRGRFFFDSDETRLGQGLESAMVGAFVAQRFADPDASAIQTDRIARCSPGKTELRCNDLAGLLNFAPPSFR